MSDWYERLIDLVLIIQRGEHREYAAFQQLESVLLSEPLAYFNKLGVAEGDAAPAKVLAPELLELDTMSLGVTMLAVAHALLHRRLLVRAQGEASNPICISHLPLRVRVLWLLLRA